MSPCSTVRRDTNKMTESTMKGGGLNPQLCYPPNSAASTCFTTKTTNIGVTRFPYETMVAQITKERILNSHEDEYTLSSTRFKCGDWVI